jgi:hypothetical protein
MTISVRSRAKSDRRPCTPSTLRTFLRTAINFLAGVRIFYPLPLSAVPWTQTRRIFYPLHSPASKTLISVSRQILGRNAPLLRQRTREWRVTLLDTIFTALSSTLLVMTPYTTNEALRTTGAVHPAGRLTIPAHAIMHSGRWIEVFKISDDAYNVVALQGLLAAHSAPIRTVHANREIGLVIDKPRAINFRQNEPRSPCAVAHEPDLRDRFS